MHSTDLEQEGVGHQRYEVNATLDPQYVKQLQEDSCDRWTDEQIE